MHVHVRIVHGETKMEVDNAWSHQPVKGSFAFVPYSIVHTDSYLACGHFGPLFFLCSDKKQIHADFLQQSSRIESKKYPMDDIFWKQHPSTSYTHHWFPNRYIKIQGFLATQCRALNLVGPLYFNWAKAQQVLSNFRGYPGDSLEHGSLMKDSVVWGNHAKKDSVNWVSY